VFGSVLAAPMRSRPNVTLLQGTLTTMATVSRIHHDRNSADGLTTLEQRFRFEGAGLTAKGVAEVLLIAPLTGNASVFGERPGEEGSRSDSSRALSGFSPAPGFRFDVDLVQLSPTVFLVRFSQPDRAVPYLQGEFVWSIDDHGDGSVVFDEQINTAQAMEVASQPLNGLRPSLRRWLFFLAGHAQVMKRATNNIAGLVSTYPNTNG